MAAIDKSWRFFRAAIRLPIRTFSSGATNSMRGASFLAGVGMTGTSIVKNSGGRNIIVVDVSNILRGRVTIEGVCRLEGQLRTLAL